MWKSFSFCSIINKSEVKAVDNNKLTEIFKHGNLVIPMYLLQNYKKLKISIEEFVFFMYLYNQGEEFLFNPEKIRKDLSLELVEVMNYISVLGDKHLIAVETVKNEKGLIEEVVKLDAFYHRLSGMIMEDVVEEDHSNSNIFGVIEKEFGRTLSPMEYEIIKAWLDNHMSEEIITEALKEATFNGVSNLRYIDKILYEWEKLGLKTKEDVLNNKMKHRKEREKEKMTEIFDYDWFDDDE